VILVRRQVKRLGSKNVFALPKNEKEREVPMSASIAAAAQQHLEALGSQPVTLPWKDLDGDLRTVDLIFTGRDGLQLRARSYDEQVWKPVLAAVGVIPQPTRDRRHRKLRYQTDRLAGLHALRHYFASVALADGINIKELAEYLGHHDPAFTLRQYTHLLVSSHERARLAIDRRLSDIISQSHGALTELRPMTAAGTDLPEAEPGSPSPI
jgi:integrase